MARYITVPIVSEPQDILADAIAYIQTKFPGWQPRDGNIDTVLLEAFSAEAADLRTIESQVPDTIFRTMGATLFNIPPVAAAVASVLTTWTLSDSLGHTITAGTQVGIRDSVGTLIPFVVVADVTVLAGASTTLTGEVQLVAVTPGSAANLLGTPGGTVELIDPISWVASITQTTSTSGGVDDETDEDYLSRLATELQLLTPRPILEADFAVLARKVPGVYRAVAIDNYNAHHNLLTLNQSDIETSAAGWGLGNVNCSVSRTTAQSFVGSASLAMTSTAGGNMSTQSNPYTVVPVTPGEKYTGTARFRAATAGRACYVALNWLDSGGSFLSQTAVSTTNDTTTGWISKTVSGDAPAGAAYVVLALVVNATGGASEVHYVDTMQVRHGVGSDWVPGGTSEVANERMIGVAGMDADGVPISPSVQSNMTTYLESLRELNFTVDAIDPQVSTVDVSFSATIAQGFVEADTIDQAEIAVTTYLSSINWALGSVSDPLSWVNNNVVRYLELATVINNVTGIDVVTALTLGINGGSMTSADHTLPGVVPITSPGTITGTAV